MSIERRKSKKEKKTGKIARAVLLGAELIAGTAAVNAARNYELPKHIEQGDPKHKDFRRSDDVLDRRGEHPEAALLAQQNADLEPEPPINDDALNSSLAIDAGINHIKSPAQIMRERQARAKVLAQQAHDAWARERAKKKKH